MKWLWMIILTIFGFAPKTDTLAPIPTSTPVIRVAQGATIAVNNEEFAYAYIIVSHSADLSLVPNFSHPKDVQTLMSEHSCASAVNGGFYDTAGKPLGYFFADTHPYGTKIVSSLVNGFFWVDTAGTALISTALPDMQYRFALQTGPVILFNGQTMRLTIQNDERARRMVVTKTADNTILFIAVYSADSVFSGPMLSALPTIVSEISVKENLGIVDAMNLDGGSASAFYSKDTHLSELTPVGSIFCVQ